MSISPHHRREYAGYAAGLFVALLAAALLALTVGAAPSRSAATACGLPSATPLWIEYGEGSVRADTRAVLAHPGVVVATSGTAVPVEFRKSGAATMYWVLHLDRLVGEPADPADPATIPATVAKLLDQAKTSSACDTPWIALNELLGSGAVAPWSATTTQYRADVLALVQGLAAGGAHPALLVHGDPTVAGATAEWWQQLAKSGDIIYEAYYDASHIYPMGPVMGNRRMRMGIRNVVTLFESADIPAARLGVMLGFHSAQTPGIAGRQGLQPKAAWLRVVKWEALAARQVATEEHLTSIWSWGWGTFGPESVDADKAAAACTYLWAHDPSLCNAPAGAGVTFNTSKVEGQIVVPKGAFCTFAGGHIWQAGVKRLARLTGDPQVALTALFARAAMSRVVAVGQEQILAAEQAVIDRSFHGDRQKYLAALARRHATLETARGVIGDELRRRALPAWLTRQGFDETVFGWTAGQESKLVTTATCLGDVLPGSGNFPASDDRDIGVVPLPALLPFLFADRTPPAAPAMPTATVATTGVTVAWTAGVAPDLAGYVVIRSVGSIAPGLLTPVALQRLTFVDKTVPKGQTATYVIRAVDSSGNLSAPSPAVTVTVGVRYVCACGAGAAPPLRRPAPRPPRR